MIEVVIADHQELFRAGLVEVLSDADDVRILGQAQSLEQFAEYVEKGQSTRISFIDELSAGIPEDPADVKASQDRTAAHRRGE